MVQDHTSQWIGKYWLNPKEQTSQDSQLFIQYLYMEDVSYRPKIQKHLSQLLLEHHTNVTASHLALNNIGYPLLAQALLNDPLPRDEITRRAHFMEVLLSNWTSHWTNFLVPVRRLQFNPNLEQSMKGADLLGFQLTDETQDISAVLIAEAKYRGSFTTKMIEDGYEQLIGASKQTDITSLEFNARVLEFQNQRSLADRIRQLGKRINNNPSSVPRHYLLFCGNPGQTRNPFLHLHTQATAILSTLTAVHISFGTDFDHWLNAVYESA